MEISIKIEEHIPLLEDILEEWEDAIGRDFQGYKNHVYRMINFCFAQGDLSDEAREKNRYRRMLSRSRNLVG